jgi:hypothetical protein
VVRSARFHDGCAEGLKLAVQVFGHACIGSRPTTA